MVVDMVIVDSGNIYHTKGGCSDNTDYVKVPIISRFIPRFSLPYFPILCELDNLTLKNHNFHMVCIRPCILKKLPWENNHK